MFTYILDKEVTREVDREKVANEVLELAGMKEGAACSPPSSFLLLEHNWGNYLI